eukprot:snap_masked-scaffold_6-processed-gene-1.6-mRNA-1 protein AED:0.40 eAED:0.40 QI:0/-1/0/1/-1/1/1/0/334
MSFLVFLANSFVIYPVTRKILGNQKYKISTRYLQAALFLLLVSLLSMSLTFSEILSKENAFRILEVSRNAETTAIRLAYKQKIVHLHPDTNPGQEELFIKVKSAYDLLLNPSFRLAYDRFGDSGILWLAQSGSNSESELNRGSYPNGQSYFNDVIKQGVLKLVVDYCGMLIMTFVVLSISGANEKGRQSCFLWLFGLLSLEMSFRFSDDVSFSVPFVSWITVDQGLELLRQSYFTICSGIIAFTSLTGFDSDLATVELLKAGILQQEKMFQYLCQLDQKLRITKTATKEKVEEDLKNLPRNLRRRPNVERKEQAGIPRFVFVILFYAAMNYFFK